LVSRLGGKELYGNDPNVALRELIQNASDAVRARRALERRDSDWGEILISTGCDDTGPWIEVRDNGIGMSERVLTGPLLDFGRPFWGTGLMSAELPGLATSGFKSTGCYGIGFFSVFMLGDKIRVTTLRSGEASQDTQVLEFRRWHDLPTGASTRELC
jgi:HSP90 family molecular chaperone